MDVTAGGKRRGPVEDADVVQPQETPLEKCCRPSASLRFTHQVKFNRSLWKTFWPAKSQGRLHRPGCRFSILYTAPCRPGMHGGIYIAKVPTSYAGICPLGCMYHSLTKQPKLIFRKVRVHQGQWYAMKGEIPRRKPGVFPFVRHREDFGVIQMVPVGVAALVSVRWRRRLGFVAFDPLRNVEVVKLFGPDQTRESLAMNALGIFIRDTFLQVRIKLVSFSDSLFDDLFEIAERRMGWGLR